MYLQLEKPSNEYCPSSRVVSKTVNELSENAILNDYPDMIEEPFCIAQRFRILEDEEFERRSMVSRLSALLLPTIGSERAAKERSIATSRDAHRVDFGPFYQRPVNIPEFHLRDLLSNFLG
eukprot:TRINITY_DN16096_c0_g1_i1.p1 TRINITY_DN16096_c0_g1~~TRINITY_DN16096_c0_g1_i1.p1  ORF type:complete len:121 (-),score=33.26 TRINITY_DN16096_c0_g1_i1:22-384(-)